MKKLEFIEAINERLPVKQHPKVIAVWIGRAFNQIIYDTFRKDFSNLDIYTRTYKNVPVKHDDDTDVWYSDLPVDIIQLPNSGDGVRSIHSMKGKGPEFTAKKAGMHDIHRKLEVSKLDGLIPYYIMDGRVEYGLKGGIDKIGKVRMRIVPQFESYGMLDEIHIPAGKDQHLFELILQFASGLVPEKEINDQSRKT